ncbi:MAG: hypothetical protein DHS20C17_12140 [Cyclobacteriaceae bacterium]|nr:MAG: hypothetical protein DHS20C17_12140 [Cyclobacteriaceae bacterium]
MNLNFRSLIINLAGLACIGLSLNASDYCALVELDKNYLISGEYLRGALHTKRCDNALTQVMIVLINNNEEVIGDAWIKLETVVEPFTFQIPTDATPGIYRLAAYSNLTGQIVYQTEIPIFKPEDINPGSWNDSTLVISRDIPEFSRGLMVEWRKSSTEAGACLDLTIRSSATAPLNLSLKVTDHAQSMPLNPKDYPPGTRNADYSPPGLSTGFTFSGYLKRSAGNLCAYCPVVLIIPEETKGIFYTMTDGQGKFTFSGLNHYGNKKAYLWSSRYNNDSSEFVIEDTDNTPKFAEAQSEISAAEAAIRPQLLRKRMSRKLGADECHTDRYEGGKNPRNYDQIVLLNHHDVQVIFDEYVLGSDMKETIKSIVPNVNFIRKNQIRVFSYEQSRNFPDTPFILLDGIPIGDSILLRLDPRSVQRIDVIHRSESQKPIGNLARNGVLSVVTKSGTDHTLMPGVAKTYIRGFNNLKRAMTPDSTICPLPHVLYWEPQLVITRDETHLKVPLPAYYVVAILSISGFDATGNFIQYQSKLP